MLSLTYTHILIHYICFLNNAKKCMKLSIILIFIFSFNLITAQENQLDSTVWKTNYEQVLSTSKTSGKAILMVFSGCDWCVPCIKLKKQIFNTEKFSNWAKENVACIMLDFPSCKKNALSKEQTKQNESLAERFNSKGVFPLVILLDSDEKVLGSMGYQDITITNYIKELEKILEKENL